MYPFSKTLIFVILPCQFGHGDAQTATRRPGGLTTQQTSGIARGVTGTMTSRPPAVLTCDPTVDAARGGDPEVTLRSWRCVRSGDGGVVNVLVHCERRGEGMSLTVFRRRFEAVRRDNGNL